MWSHPPPLCQSQPPWWPDSPSASFLRPGTSFSSFLRPRVYSCKRGTSISSEDLPITPATHSSGFSNTLAHSRCSLQILTSEQPWKTCLSQLIFATGDRPGEVARQGDEKVPGFLRHFLEKAMGPDRQYATASAFLPHASVILGHRGRVNTSDTPSALPEERGWGGQWGVSRASRGALSM